MEQMRIAEVTILRDNSAVFRISMLTDVSIWGAVTSDQRRRVNRVVPRIDEKAGQPYRQLSVNKELHAASKGRTRYRPAVNAPNSSAATKSSASKSR